MMERVGRREMRENGGVGKGNGVKRERGRESLRESKGEVRSGDVCVFVYVGVGGFSPKK